jgi:hypothetical protein
MMRVLLGFLVLLMMLSYTFSEPNSAFVETKQKTVCEQSSLPHRIGV